MFRHRSNLFIALAVAALFALPVNASPESLYLVRDIDTSGEPRTYCPQPIPPGQESPWPELCSTYRGSLPSGLTPLGERLVFVADDGERGGEPWVSDGTAAGTRLLADVCPGTCSSEPVLLGRAGDRLLFWADDGVAGAELWSTDGTPAGTARLLEVCPGPCGGQPEETTWRYPGGRLEAVEVGGTLFFVVNVPAYGRELWRSDGAAAGTRLVADLVEGPTSSWPKTLRRAGDRLYFTAAGAVWRTTAAGAVEQVFEWPEVPRLAYAVPFGGDLVWISTFEAGETRVWLLGGPPGAAAAREIASFPPQTGLVVPLGADDGSFYFVVNREDAAGGAGRPAELWRSDGSAAGTGRMQTLDGLASFTSHGGFYLSQARGRDSVPWQGGFVVSGSGVGGGYHRNGLWHVQPATGRVELIRQWLFGDLVGELRGRLLYTGYQPLVEGGESLSEHFLGQSDGTLRGTDDLVSHRRSSGAEGVGVLGPPEVALAGDLLFVSRDTAQEGRELWAMPVTALDREAVYLRDGRFRVRVRFNDHRNGGGERDAFSLPLRDGTARFWFFRPDNPEVVVKVLDGTGVNGKVWVFHGGTTDLEYHVEVRGTFPGIGRQVYSRPAGSLCGGFDTAAFEAFAARSTAVERGVAPAIPGASSAGCGGEVLCLGEDGRFRVRVRWRNQYAGGAEGVGRAVADGERAGWFWFFGPDKLEAMVKVLDGGPVNGHHWVLWGGLTTVEYDLEVTDTTTGVVRTYHHPPGDLCGGADTAAF